MAGAHFWRIAPKPIFINAYTANRARTDAWVKLIARDHCFAQLDSSFTGYPGVASLSAYNPDESTPSSTVTLSALTNAVATVYGHASSGVARASVIIGELDGIKSSWGPAPDNPTQDVLGIGIFNTVVSTVPHVKTDAGTPSDFYANSMTTSDGINTFIMRQGDEDPSCDFASSNPNFQIGTGQLSADGYTVRNHSDEECFETEANISVTTMTGNGVLRNLDSWIQGGATVGMAGTGLIALSGGPLTLSGTPGSTGTMGFLGVASVTAHLIVPRGGTDVLFPFEAIAIAGLYDQTAGAQQFMLYYSEVTYLPSPFESFRNMILTLMFDRGRPISSVDTCP
jgi:hypothetical protein